MSPRNDASRSLEAVRCVVPPLYASTSLRTPRSCFSGLESSSCQPPLDPALRSSGLLCGQLSQTLVTKSHHLGVRAASLLRPRRFHPHLHHRKNQPDGPEVFLFKKSQPCLTKQHTHQCKNVQCSHVIISKITKAAGDK